MGLRNAWKSWLLTYVSKLRSDFELKFFWDGEVKIYKCCSEDLGVSTQSIFFLSAFGFTENIGKTNEVL